MHDAGVHVHHVWAEACKGSLRVGSLGEDLPWVLRVGERVHAHEGTSLTLSLGEALTLVTHHEGHVGIRVHAWLEQGKTTLGPKLLLLLLLLSDRHLMEVRLLKMKLVLLLVLFKIRLALIVHLFKPAALSLELG